MKMRQTLAAVLVAAILPATPSFAAPAAHTVEFTVPVDISAMPYVKAFTVGCRLTYPSSVVLTSAQSGMANNRYDQALSGGEFHGKIKMSITAAEGPAPTGYKCEISLTPSDDSGGFTPVPSTETSVPAEHRAAAGTPLVTTVNGSFEVNAVQIPRNLAPRVIAPGR